MTDQRRLEVPSVGPARCHGSGSYEDGKFYWREGCDDCQRRVAWTREALITLPPIIAFECEYRIGPDKNAAQLSPMTDHFVEVPKKVLSPAAQAVLDAAINVAESPDAEAIVSAAIRVLADQLQLELPLGDTDADAGVFVAHHAIYSAILTIAGELERWGK